MWESAQENRVDLARLLESRGSGGSGSLPCLHEHRGLRVSRFARKWSKRPAGGRPLPAGLCLVLSLLIPISAHASSPGHLVLAVRRGCAGGDGNDQGAAGLG